ncbi:MAG: hypothetical protein MZV49_17445 [Rhodopseudomonas palustris]|nr:hypothetical protein [Rhodopseudomonas palustris]
MTGSVHPPQCPRAEGADYGRSFRPPRLAEQRGADDVLTQLYQRTRALHLQAEKTGILAAILRGAATRDGLLLLLRNLQPVYQASARDWSAIVRPGRRLLGDYHFGRAGAIAARPQRTRRMRLDSIAAAAARGRTLRAATSAGCGRRWRAADRPGLYALSRRSQRRPDLAAAAGEIVPG